MRRFILPGLVAVAAIALLALLAFGVEGKNPSSSLDAQVAKGTYPVAPNLNLKLPILGSGAKTSLAAFRGKVVIVNMFASWCTACQTEAPILSDEQRALRGHDATILGVTYLDNPSATEQFVRAHHVTYPVLRDVDGTLARSFGTFQVPETFIINRQGRVQALMRNGLSNSFWLHSNVDKILSERS